MSVTKWKVHFRVQQHKAVSVGWEGEGHPTSPLPWPHSLRQVHVLNCPALRNVQLCLVLMLLY
jgi:hypothetical protein